MDEDENPFRPGSRLMMGQALLGFEVILLNLSSSVLLGLLGILVYLGGILWIRSLYKSLE